MMKNQTTKFVYCGKGQAGRISGMLKKKTFSKCHDGSIRKSVIKETYAKVTIRKRHQTEKNRKENGISDTCEIFL